MRSSQCKFVFASYESSSDDGPILRSSTSPFVFDESSARVISAPLDVTKASKIPMPWATLIPAIP